MNEERVPGSSPEDQELDRRWRNRSVEEPSSSTDMRIRAAAREAIQPSASHAARATRRTRRWMRFAPLAAAASIALLAVGLVRLIPRDEYQALPTPKLAHPDEAREPATAAPSERESAVADAQHALSEPLQAPRSEPPPVSATRDALAHPTERARPQDAMPQRDAPRARDAEAVVAEEPRATAPAETRSNNQAAIEQAAKASEVPPPSTAITTTAAASAARHRLESAGSIAASSAFPAALAAQVQNDAAKRTGLDSGLIRILAADPIEWLDASLGCEEAPSSAPEARVSGYVVTVDAGGTILRYHTDGHDRIRVCEDE
jgi:hypothetical protein